MQIRSQWQNIIKQEQAKPYYKKLTQAIALQRESGEVIYPNENDVFNAFKTVDLSEIKVVILGQDPYHGCNNDGQPQAHGLAFSVPEGTKVPPSLANIYKELATDIDATRHIRNTYGKAKQHDDLDEITHVFSHYTLKIQPRVFTISKPHNEVMESLQILWYNPQTPQKVGLAAPVKKLLTP